MAWLEHVAWAEGRLSNQTVNLLSLQEELSERSGFNISEYAV